MVWITCSEAENQSHIQIAEGEAKRESNRGSSKRIIHTKNDDDADHEDDEKEENKIQTNATGLLTSVCDDCACISGSISICLLSIKLNEMFTTCDQAQSMADFTST